jgi:hypothetical protein
VPHSSKSWGLRVLGTLALAAVSCAAQQTTPAPADSQTPLPKGKILFERHEPPVSPDTDPAQVTPPTQDETPQTIPKSGVSSSSGRHPRTLKHRTNAPDDAAADTPPATSVEAPAETLSSSTSNAPEERATRITPRITAADRDDAAKITDAQRRSLAITSTDLDLHLNSHTGDAEVRAQLVVRNTGSQPLSVLPLRVSGALQWQSARIMVAGHGSTPIPVKQHNLADDLDHTGVAAEIALSLPSPLMAGESVSLDLYYVGSLSEADERLLALGAPPDRALRTDWDTVSDAFTGLRGLGNVLWYPVTTPPASLHSASAVPDAVEHVRAADASSRFHLRLAVEYAGFRPDSAFFCGQRFVFPAPAATADASDGGVAVAEWDRPVLGPRTPSLFIAQAAPRQEADGLLRVVTDNAETATALGAAVSRLRPMMSEWLGAAPLASVDIIDLPIPGATGFSDGTLFVAPLGTVSVSALAPALVQPLSAAWMPPDVSAAWLREGIPTFLQAVWSERSQGRAVALHGLAANAAALGSQAAAVVPPISSSSSKDAAEPQAVPALATCDDPACTRARSAYVFEMLRSMLGDSPLQQAISGWRQRRTAAGTSSQPGTPAAETADMKQMLQQVAGKRDLGWFFQSWIDAGHTLPDLTIVTVAPRRVERNAPVDYLPARKPVGGPIGPEPVPQVGDPTYEAEHKAITPGDRVAPAIGSWLVAVEVQNTGDAEAEVPVTVRAGDLTNTMPLRVPGHGRATIRVPFEADPQEVVVNDGSVPEARVTTHRRSISNLPPMR